MDLPLKVGDKLVGVIAVDNKGSKNPLTYNDVMLLSDFARYTAQATENAKTMWNSTILNKIMSEIEKSTDFPELFKIITKEVCGGIKANQCGIFIRDTKSNLLKREEITVTD